jgi:RNA polymerase sigma-70 factor (ECF subfamily)
MGFVRGDQHIARDLSQEVFINVWNGLISFRADASYKTWIYRITVNTCLQYIRKGKNRKNLPLPTDEHKAKDENDLQDHEFKELYTAIGKLAEIDRLIIMMVLDELDYDEISKVVGISAVNLRVKIHRIKQRLKKILAYESGL